MTIILPDTLTNDELIAGLDIAFNYPNFGPIEGETYQPQMALYSNWMNYEDGEPWSFGVDLISITTNDRYTSAKFRPYEFYEGYPTNPYWSLKKSMLGIWNYKLVPNGFGTLITFEEGLIKITASTNELEDAPKHDAPNSAQYIIY